AGGGPQTGREGSPGPPDRRSGTPSPPPSTASGGAWRPAHRGRGSAPSPRPAAPRGRHPTPAVTRSAESSSWPVLPQILVDDVEQAPPQARLRSIQSVAWLSTAG